MLPTIKHNIPVTLILLALCLVLFEFSNVDLTIQRFFYNDETQRWILDRDEPILKFILYDGIKGLLIAFVLAVFAALLFFRKAALVRDYRWGLLVVLLSAILVPSVVGGLKTLTNMPCPRDLTHFNGNYPYLKLFEPYPQDFHQAGRMRCYPAGHASGGFALLSLFFLFKSQRNRRKALLLAMGTGWSTGLYKMLIGDHFLSHTLVTMILAWLIASVSAWLIGRIAPAQKQTADEI